MQLITGYAAVENVRGFLEELEEVGKRYGSLVQAIDPRYVVDAAHIERAVTLARRAHERDEAIADDLSLEVLLYAAGTRQIDRALEWGIEAGEDVSVAIVVDGGDEHGAADALSSSLHSLDRPACDESRIMDWFDITAIERRATEASLSELVQERVALLTVEK